MARIRELTDLHAYRWAVDLAARIFLWTKELPRIEERALAEQVRRSSRSVGANIAEAWRRRRYPRAFIRCLTDAEAEAEETRHWLRVAHGCGYLSAGEQRELDDAYDALLGLLVRMVATAPRWRPARAANAAAS